MKRLISFVFLLVSFMAGAQGRADKLPPKWLYGTPETGKVGTKFVTVRLENAPIGNVSSLALGKLVEALGDEWNVRQSLGITNIDFLEREKGVLSNSSQRQISRVEINADGKPVAIKCMLADEWVHRKNGVREYCAVYQVADDLTTPFSSFSVTNRYGVAPHLMSLIPGVGKFYKGDALKGGLLLGACVVGGAGIVFLESQRRASMTQRDQTHDVNLIKKYAANEKNLSIARNVTIGITAALYLYNLIDAAVAPGARRLVVSPAGVSYSF